MSATLRILSAAEVLGLKADPLDPKALEGAAGIVAAVAGEGEAALRLYAEKFGEVAPGAALVIDRDALRAAFDALPADDQQLLQRVADRIRHFAEAQRAALQPMWISLPGGEAGHDVSPVEVAGCYAPGGGFPLPSSVLMTAITARAAGVSTVVVASPKPLPITLAAAYISGADMLLACGGAHAIAALAHGVAVPACDVVVGPGNPWVTAAKHIVSSRVRIDMLAGPSELLILADETADPAIVAADLLAQAEHGFDSLPVLVTTAPQLVDAVNVELARQLATLPTAETAAASVTKGFAVIATNLDEAIEISDRLAPEHLEVLTRDAQAVASRLKHYGGLFIGTGAAEVLGDYGAGPNHTLPTGGTSRFTGGLSVFNFLRIRTWMRIDDPAEARELAEDARDLARHERLEGHARSAERRLPG